MFIDWQAGPPRTDYRFVIIGAGPAGLYLAQQLSTAQAGRVLVVEAGNTGQPLGLGEGYYELAVTGQFYPALGSRLSAFGGTSNHWGGNSHPLWARSFGSGPDDWPIVYDDFARYLDDAARFLNLRPFADSAGSTSPERGALAGYEQLGVRRFQFSSPVLRLGDAANVRAFAALPDVDILTDTRLVDLALTSAGDRVASLTLLHRPGGQVAQVAAPQVILCAGGIENARLLLWAGRKYPSGNPLQGGPSRLTGTHFTEKPFFSPVDLYVDAAADLSDVVPRDGDNGYLAWELADDVLAAHGLPRFGVFPEAPLPADRAAEAAAPLYASPSGSYSRLLPSFQFEEPANAGSYVGLAAALDVDGVARAELHWDVPAVEAASYRRAVLLFCSIVSQKGLVRARLREDYRDEDWTGFDFGRCNHHLGTTRMGRTARDGVVDGDCRVFGVSNLFVAGSSVFPSSDYVNPTLNLVALAGRLAHHLAGLD